MVVGSVVVGHGHVKRVTSVPECGIIAVLGQERVR